MEKRNKTLEKSIRAFQKAIKEMGHSAKEMQRALRFVEADKRTLEDFSKMINLSDEELEALKTFIDTCAKF